MKKRNNKFMLILTILIICAVAINSLCFFSTKSTKNTTNIKDSKIIAVEDLFVDEQWNDSFEKYLKTELGENYKEIINKNWNSAKNAEEIRNLFSTRRDGKTIYPDYVGGFYINKDNELVIQIVNNKIPRKEESSYLIYDKMINVSKTSIIENVNYSYNELLEIKNKIEDYYRINNSTQTYAIYNNTYTPIESFTLGENVSSIYIDEINNTVVVSLYKCTDEEIEKFKETIIDSSAITFKQDNGYTKEHNPGGPLPASNTCSLGYRARVTSNTSTVGIMTAAHCSQTGGEVGHVIMNNNGSLFGTVWSWQESGPIDAAFIATPSSVSITNRLNRNSSNNGLGPILSTTVVRNLTVGQWVGKVGIKTNYTVGKITSNSVSVSGHYDFIGADYESDGGDSGGIVFSGSTSDYKTAGIHSGKIKGTTTTLFSSAYIINTQFGLSRY